MKTSISLNDLIDCIAKLVQENNLDFHVSYPEKAYALDKGHELWKINLGAKDHPFWIYGSKEKVFEEYHKFNKQMCSKAASVSASTTELHVGDVVICLTGDYKNERLLVVSVNYKTCDHDDMMNCIAVDEDGDDVFFSRASVAVSSEQQKRAFWISLSKNNPDMYEKLSKEFRHEYLQSDNQGD